LVRPGQNIDNSDTIHIKVEQTDDDNDNDTDVARQKPEMTTEFLILRNEMLTMIDIVDDNNTAQKNYISYPSSEVTAADQNNG
jgi:hypothetical protein